MARPGGGAGAFARNHPAAPAAPAPAAAPARVMRAPLPPTAALSGLDSAPYY
jgi:hypothetical protein